MHLKKQRAKAQLGKDASWAQKKAVDAFAGQSPEAVRKAVQKWSLGLTAAALLLGLGGFFLYSWSVPAGVAVHVLAAVAAFVAYRVRKQAEALAQMARSL